MTIVTLFLYCTVFLVPNCFCEFFTVFRPERFYPEIIESKNGLQLQFQFLGKSFGKSIPAWGKPRVLRKLRENCCENYYRDYGDRYSMYFTILASDLKDFCPQDI